MTDLHAMFGPETHLDVILFFLPALWAEYRGEIIAASVVTAVLALAVGATVNALTSRLFRAAALPSEVDPAPEVVDDPERTVEVRPARRRPAVTGTICTPGLTVTDPSEQTVVMRVGELR